MSDLEQYAGRVFARRESRLAGRALARLDVQAQVSLARIEVEADLQAARVRGVAYVGGQALHATAMLSELEGQLGRMVPEARGRLAAVADLTSLGLAEIVADTARKVSR